MKRRKKLTLRESELISLIKEVAKNLGEQLLYPIEDDEPNELDNVITMPNAAASKLPDGTKKFDSKGYAGLTQVPYGFQKKHNDWTAGAGFYKQGNKLWEVRDYGRLDDKGILSAWDFNPVYENTLFIKNLWDGNIKYKVRRVQGPEWATRIYTDDAGGSNPWAPMVWDDYNPNIRVGGTFHEDGSYNETGIGGIDYMDNAAALGLYDLRRIEPVTPTPETSDGGGPWKEGSIIKKNGIAPVTLYVNNDPTHWYENSDDDYWENWVFSGPEGTNDNWSRNLNVTIQIQFYRQEYILSQTTIKFYLKFWIGTMGREAALPTFYSTAAWTGGPMDPDGTYAWLKSDVNPGNWTIHGVLDGIAIIALFVAGFFTWGQSWWGVAAYGVFVAAELINIYTYLDENDPYSAGLQALFLVVPLGLLSKYGLKGIITATPKIVGRSMNLVKGIRGGVPVKTTLKLARSNPDMLKILRALVESGKNGIDDFVKATRKMAGNTTPTPADIKAFRKLVTENSDELAKVFKTFDDDIVGKIIKEQNEALLTKHMRLINSASFKQILVDAAIVLTIYDTNLIWNLATLNFGEGAISTLPTLGADAFINTLSVLGPSGPCDIISYTKDVKTNKYYNCSNVQAAYSAATSSICVQEGNCSTIPITDEDYGDRYNIGEREGYKSANFNLAMRKDWVNGWKPDQCLPDVECFEKDAGQETIDFRKQLLKKKLEDSYGISLGAAAEEYELNMEGEKLIIGGIEIESGDEPSDELLEALLALPPTTFDCIIKIAIWYVTLSEDGWEELEQGGEVDEYIKKNIPCWANQIVL